MSAGAAARGSVALFAVAFVAMLAAGVLLGLAARTFLREAALLWASIALSAGATVLAVLAAAVPRRS